MRGRDIRALAFCAITSLVLLFGSFFAFGNLVASLALTGAYDAWLLTRPRMLRVIRRLRGEPDWSGYFKND